jgi:DNA invertase Pin-like site-specific DNA recombinase
MAKRVRVSENLIVKGSNQKVMTYFVYCHTTNGRLLYNDDMSRTKRSQVSGEAGVMRVIGYVRVSTVDQADSGAGLEVQRGAIIAECARRGWELLEIIEDAGASGKSLNRPGLQKALDTLSTGGAEVLVTSKLDRLSRSVKDFCEVVDLSQYYGWKLIVMDCNVDTSTPAGEMLANIMATFAQFERRMIGTRTKEALKVKKDQGVKLGRPVNLSTEVLDLIAEQRRSGASYAKIADTLNAQSVPTAQGGAKWYPSTVQQTMARLEVAA